MKKYLIIGVALTILAFIGLIGFGNSGDAQDPVTNDIGLLVEVAKVTNADNSEVIVKLIDTLFNVEVDDALGGTYYNRMIYFDEGIGVDGTTIIDGDGSFPAFTQGGGVFASTTGAAGILLAADFDTENVISLAPLLVATTAATITFPASSTLSAMIPNAGDSRQIWLSNSTTTPYALTIAGNTGTILKNNSSTAITLEGKFTQMEMVRQSNSDIFLYWNNN